MPDLSLTCHIRRIPFIMKKENDADDRRQQRTHRGGQSHRKQGIWEQPGHQVSTRDSHQHDGDKVLDERQHGFAISTEESAEAEMHARKDTVHDVGPYVLCAHNNDGLFTGK